MYHPLLVFDGQDGFPLAAVLRPGNSHASKGALAVLKRLMIFFSASDGKEIEQSRPQGS
jgi:hypothetical protein